MIQRNDFGTGTSAGEYVTLIALGTSLVNPLFNEVCMDYFPTRIHQFQKLAGTVEIENSITYKNAIDLNHLMIMHNFTKRLLSESKLIDPDIQEANSQSLWDLM